MRLWSFPELYGALAALSGEFILDGEIVAWRDDRPLPFTELQKRLGRKQPDMWLLQDVPASFIAFDLLTRTENCCWMSRSPNAANASRDYWLVSRLPLQVQLAGAQRCVQQSRISEKAFADSRSEGTKGSW